MLDADEEQADAQGQSKRGVDGELSKQVAADPLAGLIQGPRRAGHAAVADQPNHAVAQVLAVQEHEDHQHQHENRLAKRAEDGSEDCRHPRQPGRGFRLEHGSDGFLSGWGRGTERVLLRTALRVRLARRRRIQKVLDRPLHVPRNQPARHLFERGDLALDVLLVSRQGPH